MPRTMTVDEFLALSGPAVCGMAVPDDKLELWVRNAPASEIAAAKSWCVREMCAHTKRIIERTEAMMIAERHAAAAEFIATATANVSKNTEVVVSDIKTPIFKSRDFWLVILGVVLGTILTSIVSIATGQLSSPPEGTPVPHTTTEARP